MGFIAGIIAKGGDLGPAERGRFLRAAAAMEKELPWRVATIDGEKHIFARCGFDEMWQGPAMASLPGCDAVAEGIQWREVPRGNALGHLARAFLKGGGCPDNCFDRFSFAALDRASGRAVIATDPLGVELVFHAAACGAVIFSSHQIFIRNFLGAEAAIDWSGVFEYLLIGHNLADKSLCKGVKVLPPGGIIRMNGGEPEVGRYTRFEDVPLDDRPDIARAAEALLSHLRGKIDGYAALARRRFAVSLSGGLDSRLTLSLFAQTGRVALTFTTQQNTRFGERLISEKKIARECARALGLRNRYTAPVIGASARRTRIMDYASWYNGWSFAMAERMPLGRYILTDGFLGCFYHLGRILSPELYQCLADNGRNAAADLLFSRYLEGFSYYIRGIGEWRNLLNLDLLDECAARLKRDIAEEVHGIRGDDFITAFFMANRGRRAASTLPRHIFGRRGAVVLPFCDVGYRQKLLSYPLRWKYDASLGRELLRRGAPALSAIPSTNTEEHAALRPYLSDSFPRESGWDRAAVSLRRCAARIGGIPAGGCAGDAQDILDDPPLVFSDAFAPALKQALDTGDREFTGRHAFCLHLLRCLDPFFRAGRS